MPITQNKTNYHIDYGMKMMEWAWNVDNKDYGVHIKTRTEARAKAIEKACELRNKQLEL